ncbi:glycoside hydrolase family 43 protein, partial [Trematosphaeria pertusa]
NFPDPTLLRHNGTWYVYGTNNAAGILRSKLHGKSKGLGKANVQLATSSNLLNWTLHDQADDPLQVLGDWVSKKNMPAEADRSALVRRANVWAPDILQRPDGKFVLYYSATSANASHHCVGTAIGDIPTGPFESQSTPLACPVERGGAIDPASFTDSDGSIYVSYKVDGNAKGNGGQCGNSVPPLKDTPILLQKMERDGITPSGSPVKILDRTDEDGPLVEAPALFKSDEDIYFLFFSSGCTRNPSYDLKYATSMNITGPYMRASGELLKTGSYSLYAPGSASIWRDEQDWCMAFHA